MEPHYRDTKDVDSRLHPDEVNAEMLALEEADAWFEYLDATRSEAGAYAELEPWAWARLNQRLRAVERKRARLESAALLR